MTNEMENREWLNEYTLLKQVNANNPFTVPSGYFDQLGQRVMSVIRLDELKNNMPLSGFTVPENYFTELDSKLKSRITIENAITGPTGFTVPPNYFEDLSGNIQSRINIENALTENEGFAVPENYFDELSRNIQSRIFVEEALSVEHNAFALPENYFDELSNNIQSRIFVEEALSIDHNAFAVPENYFDELHSQITSRIFVEEALSQSTEGLTVPQDYFTGLNKSILNQTVNQTTVKSKGKVVRMFSSTAFKYATAACLALMVGTGIFIQRFNAPSAVHNRSFLHKQLSSVSVQDIQSYLQADVDGSDTQTTVAAEGLPVNDAGLNDALKNYISTQ